MWSTLSLLLLFGTVIGTLATECKLYELPKDGTCEITLKWMARDDKEALATCLEYFPTTFVKGKTVNGYAQCTVTAAYTCEHHESKHPDVFLMFDKCYVFPKENSEYVKGTIPEYLTADASKMCKGGKLSVFYSYTHAKFVGMKAHSLYIDKLWIGITSDGRMIEGKKAMMHKNLWKVVEGSYWEDDEKLKYVASGAKGEYSYPDNVKYFFMRTRTDHVMGRMQGSFERTTEASKATFACEFESKFTSALTQSYCDKLPALGIDSVFDNKNPDKSRCLFISSNKYAFNGKFDDMKNIKGCLENPSITEHSAGMDDGTGDKDKYKLLTRTGKKLRLAAFITQNVQKKGGPRVFGNHYGDEIEIFFPWRHMDHHGNLQRYTSSMIKWDSEHPKNENTDFPGDSWTMGLNKNGEKIDMPKEVLAHAVCSIRFFQQCGNEKPCGSKQECKDQNSFQSKTNSLRVKEGFFTCSCPGPMKKPEQENLLHTEVEVNGEKTCQWKLTDKCVWLDFGDGRQDQYLTNNVDSLIGTPGHFEPYNDKLQQIVVRDGCTATVRPGGPPGGKEWKLALGNLLHEVGYGTHDVPNAAQETLTEEWSGMGASSVACKC